MKRRGAGMVGCNVQTAVDTKNHLIVAHEVINNGQDRDPPGPSVRSRNGGGDPLSDKGA